MKRLLVICILVFSGVGVLVSSYSLVAHYATSLYSVCNVNETFDCSSVNTSIYSEIFGMPVALLGILGYASIGVLLVVFLKNKNLELLKWAGTLSFGAFIFSLYLSWIEAFVLYTWCLFCLASQASILIVTFCIFVLYYFELKAK